MFIVPIVGSGSGSQVQNVAKLTPGLSRRLLGKFKHIRDHEGLWLSPLKHTFVGTMRVELDRVGAHLTKELSEDDISRVHEEMMTGEAMYFAHDKLHR